MSALPSPIATAVVQSWPKHRTPSGSNRAELRMLARRLRQRDTSRRLDTFRAGMQTRFADTRTATVILTISSSLLVVAGVTLTTTGFGF